MNSSSSRPGKGLALFATALALLVAAPLVGSDYTESRALAAAKKSAAEPAAPLFGPATRNAIAPAGTTAGMPAEGDIRRYSAIIERASRAYGVDVALIHAVIMAESSFDPDARSPAGASGLMQLMPGTARHYGVEDLFDPHQNIHAGVRCLRDLLQQFDGNLELALAAYNAGTTAVIRAGRQIPPLAETQAYVPKVIDYYRHFRALKA